MSTPSSGLFAAPDPVSEPVSDPARRSIAERAAAPEWSFLVVDDSVDYEGSDQERPGDRTVPPGTPYVVGLHMAGRYEHDWESQGFRAGDTDLLGVRRAYRGRRIGAALLAHAMRRFADDGMEVAVLDVDTDNPTGAPALYAGLGYAKNDGSTMYAVEL